MSERTHPTERISAYADGELPAEEARAVERHLRECTECSRELALLRAMGGAMRQSTLTPPDRSLWGRVHRRITRPAGWILLAGGAVAWLVLAAVEWFRAGRPTAEWFATTALLVGVALLAAGIGYEQYREWKDSPYKDIER